MSNVNHDEAKSSGSPRQKRILRLLLFISLIVLLMWLFSEPPVGSGPVSKRTRAIHNLHTIGYGQQNYAAEHNALFAAPTLVNAEGLPVHGWFTQLLPTLDSTALYEAIDLSLPWNHPNNQEYSKIGIKVALSPGLDREQNSDGYPLLHYTLNTRLFPNNESLSEDYVSRADGLANTILLGEIQEGLPAWAEPGSARDPAMGLRTGPNTMGVDVWNGTTVIGFSHGRVTTISNDIDPSVLKALSTPDGGEEIPEDW